MLIVGFENLKFPWQSEIPTECIQYTRGIAGELVDDGGYDPQQVKCRRRPWVLQRAPIHV